MFSIVTALAVVLLSANAGKASSKYCDGDYFCTPPKECCSLGCCYLYAHASPDLLSLIFWNHWYLWFIVGVAVVLGCCCGLWKRKSSTRSSSSRHRVSHTEPPTPDSCCHPPHYSRCSSFNQPPPYAEVTSKPDLYPLVISYSETGKAGSGGYLMVQYFRNFIMRPLGSLSATSTADSLSSSLFYNNSNEADSLIPPPYSSAPGSVDHINTSPPDSTSETVAEVVAVATTEVIRPEGERRQARPSLCGLSNVSSISTAPLDSPPQATTPTLNKISSHQSLRAKYRSYFSRSAPSTPSSRLTPITFPSGESSPLLHDLENTMF